MRCPPAIEMDRRRLLTLAGAATLALAAPGIARGAPALAGMSGEAFGTNWRLSLPSGADTSGLRARIDHLLGELDAVFSPWRMDSTISRFNNGSAPGMAVGTEFHAVALGALDVAEKSGGYFDPTVGPLVARWGFGPIRRPGPSTGRWNSLTASHGVVSRTDPATTIDLCGIAKGHALDRIADLLTRSGHGSFLADLGGEIIARGRHPSGRNWHVGVENPLQDAGGTPAILDLQEQAVATSGDASNGFDIGGRRYSHIIDPTSGEPVESRLASVSVVMPTACAADGWATALMAAGKKGPELARRLEIPALFLFRHGGGLRRVETGAIARHLV